MITTKIAKRLECGDFSPLLFSFILTKSGEGSRRSKRCRAAEL
jgi:hypothetical protein